MLKVNYLGPCTRSEGKRYSVRSNRGHDYGMLTWRSKDKVILFEPTRCKLSVDDIFHLASKMRAIETEELRIQIN